MRFGIKTPPQHSTWDEMLAIWRAADDIDVFESAWNFDHFYPLIGDSDGPCLEGWVTLTALAQATNRIRIGCMVNGVVYRHPAVVANMAASLDIVSGGSTRSRARGRLAPGRMRCVRHRSRLNTRADGPLR